MADKISKIRVYQCECGAEPVRPLTGKPKPCDRCDGELLDRPSRVEDFKLYTRDTLKRMKP